MNTAKNTKNGKITMVTQHSKAQEDHNAPEIGALLYTIVGTRLCARVLYHKITIKNDQSCDGPEVPYIHTLIWKVHIRSIQQRCP